MAKKTLKAMKEAGGGGKSSRSTKPVVEVLQCTVDHLRWLSWVGRGFDRELVVPLVYRHGDPEPPMPGTCGISGRHVLVGDLVAFVDATASDVAHVIDILVGMPAPPLSALSFEGLKPDRRPSRRRARR